MRLLDIQGGFKIRNNSIQGRAKKVTKSSLNVIKVNSQTMGINLEWQTHYEQKNTINKNLFWIFRNEKKMVIVTNDISPSTFCLFKEREKKDLKQQLVEV